MRRRFGDCLFDSGTRLLFRGRKAVPLSPKALSILELLLERAPLAVAREEIEKKIWPKTFVAEANLTNLISEIRAAVGDSARRPRFIRTVHRFGYSFQGVAIDDPAVKESVFEGVRLYRILLGNRKVPLAAGENILGRHPDAEVRIDNSSVSRRHARISIRAGKAMLEDLQSRNGTFLRRRRLAAPAELRDGDSIRLGPVEMTFRVFTNVGSTQAASDCEGYTQQTRPK